MSDASIAYPCRRGARTSERRVSLPARRAPIASLLSGVGLCLLALVLSAPDAAAGSAPQWVERGGVSSAYPSGRFLLGFAQTEGKQEALESAKQQAAADLARQISVQIESSVVDVTSESNGQIENDLTSRIRATSDIRLDGIRFETYRKRKRVWALAILERLPAAIARRQQRDHALALTKRCLDEATAEEQSGRSREALAIYRSCRTPLSEALEHEAIAAALQRGGLLTDGIGDTLAQHASLINARVRALPHEDATSIRAAADGLAVQLARAGVGRGQRLAVAPFLYRSRDISSPFGRELAIALESSLGRTDPQPRASTRGASLAASGTRGPRVNSVVVRGTYHEEGDAFALRANAKEAGSGRLLGSAEIRVARSGVPKGIETRPANFESFARDADKLAGGDLVSGDLRIELRTDKGMRGLVYDEGEELRIAVRVNQPAWIRLIYVLTTGEHVPIEQSWYIDNSQVNQLVEYPTAFEVVPPFGVEMIHAMAHTEKPPLLATRRTQIAGQDYEVVRDGADQVVVQRGIARKAKKQVAEQTLQLTTLRAATGP